MQTRKLVLRSVVISNCTSLFYFLRLEGNTEASMLVLKVAEILSQLQQYLPCNFYNSDDPMSTVATER